jgi:hypothetical protein
LPERPIQNISSLKSLFNNAFALINYTPVSCTVLPFVLANHNLNGNWLTVLSIFKDQCYELTVANYIRNGYLSVVIVLVQSIWCFVIGGMCSITKEDDYLLDEQNA